MQHIPALTRGSQARCSSFVTGRGDGTIKTETLSGKIEKQRRVDPKEKVMGER